MRNFILQRHEDVSGVSGTGTVAFGCVFPDGTTVIRWAKAPHASTVIWDDVEKAIAVHGHGGSTEFVFLDE